MNYAVKVKVITSSFDKEFEQKCSELETELQDESVYQYYPEYAVRADASSVTGILFTAIFRIYYEVIENPVALGYGGAE